MLLTTTNCSEILDHFSTTAVNLILVGEKTPIDISQLIDEANARDLKLAGGIFPMIIFENEHLDSGVILKHIESCVMEPVLIKDFDTIPVHNQLPTSSPDMNSCIVLFDGLMNHVSSLLDSLYEEYWNQMNFVGAGCGSASLEQSPCIICNDGFFDNAALLLIVKREINLGVNHGWTEVEGPFVANKTEGNKILELNWRPAYDIYKEVVELNSQDQFAQKEFVEISQGYPFGIKREGKEDMVRDPIIVDEQGALLCLGDIPKNASLNILSGSRADLIKSAGKAAEKAIQDISPIDIFLVDCITRVLYLETEFNDELQAIKNVVKERNDTLNVEGVLSLGEVSTSKGGFLDLYNKTIVVAAMY
ncbi:FIST C-terminal domain-containing protein [Reichenbachiella agarivorans]|uniref:FIST C-terminal domain-containing protein n=1 Tax=Reichenbachiella agarivorans TaxID=2979464 RepID=A0ABY6CNM3_9BACT|nr:FIST C-terminal domain-containing protein [Reichenbachiella agarivorans]UXP32106.1 FIST C-terminal domain-containing protein [Reichenbachiella agarivorans]